MDPLFPLVYPNHYHAPGLFVWWGDPFRWEMAVLLVAVLGAGALWRGVSAVVILAPFVFGLGATVFQIDMIFHTLLRAGWTGPTGSPEESIFGALFAAHAGLLSSVTLFLLWLGLRTFRRGSGT